MEQDFEPGALLDLLRYNPAAPRVPQVEDARALLKSGIDLDYQDPKTKESAIHLCCHFGYDAVLAELLTRNPNTDLQDQYGDTGLHVAVERDQNECARLLLEAGANTKIVNHDGKTAKDIAEMPRNPEAADLFKTVRMVSQPFDSASSPHSPAKAAATLPYTRIEMTHPVSHAT